MMLSVNLLQGLLAQRVPQTSAPVPVSAPMVPAFTLDEGVPEILPMQGHEISPEDPEGAVLLPELEADDNLDPEVPIADVVVPVDPLPVSVPIAVPSLVPTDVAGLVPLEEPDLDPPLEAVDPDVIPQTAPVAPAAPAAQHMTPVAQSAVPARAPGLEAKMGAAPAIPARDAPVDQPTLQMAEGQAPDPVSQPPSPPAQSQAPPLSPRPVNDRKPILVKEVEAAEMAAAAPPSDRVAAVQDTVAPAVDIVDMPRRTAEVTVQATLDRMQAQETRTENDDLGRVHVTLHREGEDWRVVVSADNPHTLDLMRRHADQLQQDLAQQGFAGAQLDFSEWSEADPPAPDTAEAEAEPLPEMAPPPVAIRYSHQSVSPASGLDLRL